MNGTLFDDPKRWWFLTKEGFSDFECDPVAQGYEILSRHPDFPHLLTKTNDGKPMKTEDGEPTTCWEHGNKHLSRPTWERLDAIARRSFLFDFKFELHRMGLMEIAWLGPKAITFNCTEGVESILAATHYWLAAANLFHRARTDIDRFRTRWPAQSADQSTAPLTFSTSHRGNPDMVTISWGKLIEARKRHPFYRYSDNVVATLRTFLERNPDYRRHRERRLTALKKHKHLKMTGAEVIALACMAWDCQQAEKLFTEQLTTKHLQAIGRDRLKSGDSRNHLRQLRRLQEQAGCFRRNRQTKGRAKRVPQVANSVNVVGTLFPGFRAKN